MKEFNDLQERDKLKYKLCEQYGIRLIIVKDGTLETRNNINLEKFLKQQLRSINII